MTNCDKKGTRTCICTFLVTELNRTKKTIIIRKMHEKLTGGGIKGLIFKFQPQCESFSKK